MKIVPNRKIYFYSSRQLHTHGMWPYSILINQIAGACDAIEVVRRNIQTNNTRHIEVLSCKRMIILNTQRLFCL